MLKREAVLAFNIVKPLYAFVRDNIFPARHDKKSVFRFAVYDGDELIIKSCTCTNAK